MMGERSDGWRHRRRRFGPFVIGTAGTAAVLVLADLGGLSGPLVAGLALVGVAAAVVDQRISSLAGALAGGALALGVCFAGFALLEADTAELGWYAGIAAVTGITGLIVGTAFGWATAAAVMTAGRALLRRVRRSDDRPWRWTERRW